MERAYNIRYVTGASIALASGIALAALVDNIIIRIIIPIALFAVGILLLFLSRKNDKKIILLFIVTLISISIGFVAMTVDLVLMPDSLDLTGQVTARVAEEKNYYILDSITIDGKNYSGKLRLDKSGVIDLDVGDTVVFSGTVSSNKIDYFDTYSAALNNDRIYYETQGVTDLQITGTKFRITDKIASRIKEPLFKFMDSEDAGIAQSLLFGDRSALNDSDDDMAKSIGLSHVFAVSGLHVGFLAALIAYVLKKLKVKSSIRLIITMLAIVLYGCITGFPSGIKRAGIMTFVCLLAPILRRKNDAPTSLSIAIFIILISNPRELFDIGFLMSVLSVGGIIMFYRPLNNLLTMKCHNKIYRYFASSVSVTVSANAMLLPVYTDVFGYMSIYALVSNLVILPLVTFSYMLLAVSAIMCAISPAFGFLYYIIQYPIAAIRLIGDLIASLPFAKVNLTALGYVGLLYVITLVFISPINKLKTLPKISFVAGSGVIAALLICLI